MKLKAFCFIFLFGSFLPNCYALNTFESLPVNSITLIKDLPNHERNLLAENKKAICKELIKELVLVKVRYWGFDDKVHTGALIVHRTLANEVVEIFQALFAHRFAIQAMEPIPVNIKKEPDVYSNITGGFNCREVTDQPGILSQHSYGRAIDINPMINPYVKGCLIIPAGAKQYIDRIKPEKGKIIPNSFVSNLFAQYGWDWGGNWYDIVDYQHFEKRSGEKRDPFGYVNGRFGYKPLNSDCF